MQNFSATVYTVRKSEKSSTDMPLAHLYKWWNFNGKNYILKKLCEFSAWGIFFARYCISRLQNLQWKMSSLRHSVEKGLARGSRVAGSLRSLALPRSLTRKPLLYLAPLRASFRLAGNRSDGKNIKSKGFGPMMWKNVFGKDLEKSISNLWYPHGGFWPKNIF